MNDKLWMGIVMVWIIAEVSLLFMTMFSMNLEVVRFCGLGLFTVFTIMEVYRSYLERRK